ncbi:RHS repeat domain-containing protein [Riemerella columbina]|uniref:RHS repeat domain-containing protein n=1 Tax=Riemerella columbina TaxID=103810 RepID=UPI00036E278D|nr:RHS repeat-associated core domain-containing protein [Riemerella columbina]
MQFGDPVKPDNVKGGFGFKDNGVEEKNLYFYHPDHLGSSSYITDRVGKVTQHTEYIAFGEVLFDEHTTEVNMPYLFNGKELDQETGLYYYGARYYDARVSLWLNVDPLVEKTMQPYAYTNNNPVMLIDPTGMEAEDCPKCPKPERAEQTYSVNNTTYVATPSKENAKNLEWLKQTDIKEVTLTRNKADENIRAARLRLSQAISNSSAAKSVERFEQFMFMEVPASTAAGEFIGLGLAASGVYKFGSNILSKIINTFGKGGKNIANESLGAGRIRVKQWLQNVGNLERDQLIRDIEKAGFKRVGPLESPSVHYQREAMKIRLDAPDKYTPFNHMHLNYGGNKNAYDIFLNPVNYKSPAAHIPIR